MKDRRQDIINASLAVLRVNGYAGFTQPRVAVERQLVAVDSIVAASSVREAAKAIANVAVRHENTRVIMALVQAADQEAALRELFRELADGIILRAGKLLGNLNIEPTDEHCYLLHAMSVGMAVVDLATARKDGERRAARTLEMALTLMTKGRGR